VPKYKFNAIFGLKPGIDPDEAYEYWRGEHATYAKNLTLPEVGKYHINRVVHRFGDAPVEYIWGFAEFWFDDMESAQRAVGRVQNAKPDEPHVRRITPAKRFISREEEVAGHCGKVANLVKLASIFSLKSGVDPDKAYRVWREKHTTWAKDKTLPEARKYTINKVAHKYPPAGGTVAEFDIYGYEMFWFDDLASALRAAGQWQSARPDEFLTEFVVAPGMVIVKGEEIEL